MRKMLTIATLSAGAVLMNWAALAGASNGNGENGTPVPEPEMAALFAGGVVAALLWARARRK